MNKSIIKEEKYVNFAHRYIQVLEKRARLIEE